MNRLKLLFGFIFVFMVVITTWASLQEDVVQGFRHVVEYRWGWATLADTYFAFLTFYLWIFMRERNLVPRIAWFVGVMALGNMAISAYILLQIYKGRSLRVCA